MYLALHQLGYCAHDLIAAFLNVLDFFPLYLLQQFRGHLLV